MRQELTLSYTVIIIYELFHTSFFIRSFTRITQRYLNPKKKKMRFRYCIKRQSRCEIAKGVKNYFNCFIFIFSFLLNSYNWVVIIIILMIGHYLASSVHMNIRNFNQRPLSFFYFALHLISKSNDYQFFVYFAFVVTLIREIDTPLLRANELYHW